MAKRALITGITAPDGLYLAELLLDKGYEVTGIVHRSSAPNLWRIEHLLDRIELRPGDLLNQLSPMKVLAEVRPHELCNHPEVDSPALVRMMVDADLARLACTPRTPAGVEAH